MLNRFILRTRRKRRRKKKRERKRERERERKRERGGKKRRSRKTANGAANRWKRRIRGRAPLSLVSGRMPDGGGAYLFQTRPFSPPPPGLGVVNSLLGQGQRRGTVSGSPAVCDSTVKQTTLKLPLRLICTSLACAESSVYTLIAGCVSVRCWFWISPFVPSPPQLFCCVSEFLRWVDPPPPTAHSLTFTPIRFSKQ